MSKAWKWKFTLVLLSIFGGIWFVLPNFLGPSEDTPKDQYTWLQKILPDSAVQLGLDLRGGVHIVLGVDIDRAIMNEADQYVRDLREFLPKESIAFQEIMRLPEGTKIRAVLASDKDFDQFGTYIRDQYNILLIEGRDAGQREYILDLDPQKRTEIENDTIAQQLETLRNRLDQFGVAEPSITAQGTDRIIVQLPGLDDPKRAESVIGRTANLEFKLVDDESLSLDQIQSFVREAETNLPKDYKADDLNREIRSKLPQGREVLFEEQLDSTTGKASRIPYLVHAETLITGDHLDDARIGVGQYNEPVVDLKFSPRGATIFDQVTGENVGKRLAIVLDQRIQSAPVIQVRISNGRAQITFGSLSSRNQILQEAKDLALVLRAGALPAPVEILQNRVVGPELGRDSIEQGLKALLFGVFVIIIFMAIYYQLSGIVADIAVIMNVIFVLAALGALHATLTLPGIAGIIISIGMAVDANVIIYERIREELRAGKPIKGAVEAGYDRAHVTILDANLTTIVTAMVLFHFGTGPIKGFALTLIFGLIANYFTALWFTRLGYEWVFTKFKPERLSI